jgi:hypothetical protein
MMVGSRPYHDIKRPIRAPPQALQNWGNRLRAVAAAKNRRHAQRSSSIRRRFALPRCFLVSIQAKFAVPFVPGNVGPAGYRALHALEMMYRWMAWRCQAEQARSSAMIIPTEPIGSIPRPLQLIEAVTALGDNSDPRTPDDCGFSPFSDDVSTTRDTAFEKIRARVLGTALAGKMIGGG